MGKEAYDHREARRAQMQTLEEYLKIKTLSKPTDIITHSRFCPWLQDRIDRDLELIADFTDGGPEFRMDPSSALDSDVLQILDSDISKACRHDAFHLMMVVTSLVHVAI